MSLRELARRAGVSHAAPRAHFIDRQALLDAMIEEGSTRLRVQLEAALLLEAPARVQLERMARAYVSFTVQDVALMQLMFSVKTSPPSGSAGDASRGLFQVLDDALGSMAPAADEESRALFKLLFGATMQGIAALVTSGRITTELGESAVAGALDMMIDSPLRKTVVTRI